MDARQSSEPPEPQKLPVLLSLRDFTSAPAAKPSASESANAAMASSHIGELRRERRRRQAAIGASAFRYSRALAAAAAVLVLGLGYFAFSGGASEEPVADQAWETDGEPVELSPPTVTLDAAFGEQAEQASPVFAKELNHGPPPFSSPESKAPSPAAFPPQMPLTPSISTATVLESPSEDAALASPPQPQPQPELSQPEAPPVYPTTGMQYPAQATLQLPAVGASGYRAPPYRPNDPTAAKPYVTRKPSARPTPGSYQR